MKTKSIQYIHDLCHYFGSLLLEILLKYNFCVPTYYLNFYLVILPKYYNLKNFVKYIYFFREPWVQNDANSAILPHCELLAREASEQSILLLLVLLEQT